MTRDTTVQTGPMSESSLRDPAGRLFTLEHRVLRIVHPAAVADVQTFLGSASANTFGDSGRLVRTTVLSKSEAQDLLRESHLLSAATGSDCAVLEHEAIPFVSYPYEWPPEMLHAAAGLTLDLAAALLADQLGLKDATPYNVLFRGPQPVFIDILSIERRGAGDPTWLPYGQFTRTFLLPLLVNKRFGLSLDSLLVGRRDGIEPEEVYRLCTAVAKLRPPFFGLISLPVWLGRCAGPDDGSLYRTRSVSDPDRARFILATLFRRLRRHLDAVAPITSRHSPWTSYMQENSYSEQSFEAKDGFIRAALLDIGPRTVLDIGANTGHFSRLAADSGASVVALDTDPAAVGDLWKRATAERLDILPLVVDLARPTPAIGWRNREYPSFLDRARGGFDCVLMLAVIHHLMVTDGIPLSELLRLAAELTRAHLVIEYVPPDDPMFRRLCRGREHLYATLSRERFEAHSREHFDITRSRELTPGGRYLYLMLRRSAGA